VNILRHHRIAHVDVVTICSELIEVDEEDLVIFIAFFGLVLFTLFLESIFLLVWIEALDRKDFFTFSVLYYIENHLMLYLF
tara:strand:+ start:1111 stop:1353 length:243 start_codon:yes stop_codon:yes gene_type:complete